MGGVCIADNKHPGPWGHIMAANGSGTDAQTTSTKPFARSFETVTRRGPGPWPWLGRRNPTRIDWATSVLRRMGTGAPTSHELLLEVTARQSPALLPEMVGAWFPRLPGSVVLGTLTHFAHGAQGCY